MRMHIIGNGTSTPGKAPTMRVAVTATGRSLDAAVEPRFGRCACFLLVETDTMAFEVVENTGQRLGAGAGTRSAQLMAQRGARAVLTGNCGPNAHETLGAAGIEVFVDCSGTVTEVIKRFTSGQLGGASSRPVRGCSGPGRRQS